MSWLKRVPHAQTGEKKKKRKGKGVQPPSPTSIIPKDLKRKVKAVSLYKIGSLRGAPLLEAASKKRNLILQALLQLKKSKLYPLAHSGLVFLLTKPRASSNTLSFFFFFLCQAS